MRVFVADTSDTLKIRRITVAKILLVDDSSFQRKNVSKMLVAMGHEVVAAENGKVGLEKAETDQPDLIITDLLMPVMDGISYLRGLNARKLTIPVFVVSADIQETSRAECMELGAKIFLNKPIKEPDLKEAIAKALSSVPGESARC